MQSQPLMLIEEFTPHCILPSQFFDEPARLVEAPGEHRLMLAILRDAVHIYCTTVATGHLRNPRRFREVDKWIESTERRWVFSFERICEALGIDPQYLRRGLRAWKRRRLPEQPALPVEHRSGAIGGEVTKPGSQRDPFVSAPPP